MKPVLSDLEKQLLCSTAVILVNDDGTPRRRITMGNQHKPVGDFPSAKCGGTFTWEAREEEGLFIRSEVDTDVLSFLSQPHELIFIFDGQKYSYTPDLRRDLVGGRVEIIEVKKDRKEVERDESYKLKLDLAKIIYEEDCHWQFEIYDKKRIYFPEPVWENAEHICKRGRLAVPDPLKYLVSEYLTGKGGRCRFGELTELLGGWVLGRALIEAMHVHRVVSIDLRLPIAPGTPVRLVDRTDGAR